MRMSRSSGRVSSDKTPSRLAPTFDRRLAAPVPASEPEATAQATCYQPVHPPSSRSARSASSYIIALRAPFVFLPPPRRVGCPMAEAAGRGWWAVRGPNQSRHSGNSQPALALALPRCGRGVASNGVAPALICTCGSRFRSYVARGGLIRPRCRATVRRRRRHAATVTNDL